MCGIFGWLSWQEPVSEAAVRAAVDSLQARGPDDRGLWLNPAQQLALGHTRLAIRDLQTGQQPLHSLDGRLHAVVNGELYEDTYWRRHLLAQGYPLQTRSDSELVLGLYQLYGLDFVSRLRGEFAILLWDSERLVAVRDRFGIKPLCYALTPTGIRFASKAKALFASGLPAAWDLQALQQAYALQYPLPEQTLFEGVQQVLPGELMVVTAQGQISHQRYWDLDYATPEHFAEPPNPAIFLQQLQEAVSLRLAADVPVCAHLSGGIDSSAVLALASEAQGSPLPAFTVAFPGSDYDELALARQTAQHLGSELYEVPVTATDIIKHLPNTVYHCEGLMINGHAVAKALLNQAIQQAGFKVALTGEGADELLLGYTHYRADLGWQDHDPRSSGIHLATSEQLDLSALQAAWGQTPSFLSAKASLGARLQQLLAPLQVPAWQQNPPVEALLEALDSPALRALHPLHRANTLWTRLALANYILHTVGDGAEMAHSVEGRLPFLDHKLFASLRKLAPEAGFDPHSGLEKQLLRRSLQGKLPESVLTRPKHPFTAPPLGLQPPWRRFAQELLLSLPLPPGVSCRALEGFFKRWPDFSETEQRLWDPVVWTLVSASLLQDLYRLAPLEGSPC